MWFLFGEVSSSSGCLDGLRYFIVALPEPSIYLSTGIVYLTFGNLYMKSEHLVGKKINIEVLSTKTY